MTRLQKILGIGGLSLLSILTIAYLALLYVQSSYLKTQILPRAISYVESNYPVKVKIDDVQLSLFKGLVLKGLHLKYLAPGLSANADLKELKVRYSLRSFLSDRIILDALELNDLALESEIDFDAPPAPKPTPALSLGESLENLLKSLPKELSLSDFKISPAKISVTTISKGLKKKLELDEFFLSAHLIATRTNLNLGWEYQLKPHLDALQDLQFEKVVSGKGTASIENQILSYSLKASLPPLQYQTIQWEGAAISADGKAELKSVLNLSNHLEVQLLPLLTGYEKDLPISLAQGGEFACDLEYNAKGGTRIESLKFSNADKSILASLKGRLSTTMRDLSLTGDVQLSPKAATMNGEIKIPWQLVRTAGENIVLSADFISHTFSIEQSGLSIKNMTSKVPLKLELLWKGGADVRFAHLITRSPFERVDFANIRPYVADSSTNSRFDQLKLKDYFVGPLYSTVSIRQNLIIVEDYQLHLLDGLAAGHLFIDLLPGKRRVGFLGRIVGLNPKVLVNKKSSPTDKRLSTRVAAVYEFDQSMANGRLDITEIGGPQMNALIDLIDPGFKDSKLNLARTLLKVTQPKYVGIQMQQGFLDLSIDMGGAISLSDLGATGVPLSPVLRMAKERFSEQFQKGSQK